MGKKVYANNIKDTWSDDNAEQFHILPGSSEYKHREEQLQEVNPFRPDDEFHKELEERNEDLSEELNEKAHVFQIVREKSKDIGSRKYRKRMEKEVQVKEARKIAEGVTQRHIPAKEFNDELYDDGVGKNNFMRESLSDYKSEVYHNREIPTVDTNGDGVIDEKDEPEYNPYMKKFQKYM